VADAATLPPPHHDPQTVREATDALLAEQRYRDGMGLGYDERTRGFLAHLEERLAWLIDQVAALRETHPLLYWTLVVALAAVAALLIAHVLYTVRKGSRATPPGERTVGEVIREQTLATLQQRVADAEAAGELSLALRLRFALSAAQVVGLARLRTLGHLTYRELAAAVDAGGGGQGGGFAEAVVVVEDTYYGGLPLDESRYRQCVADLERGAP
jgi:hypothetical protein